MNFNYMKRIFSLIILLAVVLSCHAQLLPANPPKRELRAVWLATIGGIDWPHSYARNAAGIKKQKEELRAILDKLKQSNINTVLLQTRIRGTVIYPSQIEPWDGCMSGQPGRSPGYAPLQFAIEECHNRGMELQAWVVTMPVGKWNAVGCRSLRQKGLNIRKIGADGYMNPASAYTADYLANLCKEIVSRYDVDGIHLDYIRYPEQWKGNISKTEGRRNITRIVERIHSVVKSIKPWVKMSCSPIGKYDDLARVSSHGWNAYNKGCQEAQEWLRRGLMDQLYPMMYFRDDQFFPFAADWQEHSYGRAIAAGLGIYFLDPREGNWKRRDVERQLNVSRSLSLGHVYFRSKFFTDNTQGLRTYADTYLDAYPSLVPAMTGFTANMPAAPTWLHQRDSAGRIAWQGSTPYYNIYASTSFPVDISDARNLVAMRVEGNSLDINSLARKKPYISSLYFAITAMDRYGNESTALQEGEQDEKGEKSQVELLVCDGNYLSLPAIAKEADMKYYAIQSIAGNTLRLYLKPHEGRLFIGTLPPGNYILRGITTRHISHRLGQFTLNFKL